MPSLVVGRYKSLKKVNIDALTLIGNFNKNWDNNTDDVNNFYNNLNCLNSVDRLNRKNN